MKTTRLKEGLIKISRNRKIYLAIITMPMLTLLIYSLMVSFITIGPFLKTLLYILLFPLPLAFKSTIKLIRKKDEKIIRQNKIINLLLSDATTVSDYFVYLFFIPLILVIWGINSSIHFAIILLIAIVVIFCSMKLGKIVSEHFEQKLSK